MIQFNMQAGQKVLELGGGENRHPQATINVDVRATSKTDFTADFEKPLPISSDEFDCVYSAYCLEHISYRNVPAFLKEVFRVTMPEGKIVFLTPNTEAQFRWIMDNPYGWDGRDLFHSASCVIFGELDYPENSHKAYFSPVILSQLFQEAGFTNVLIQPYNDRKTDLVITATKPGNSTPKVTKENTQIQSVMDLHTKASQEIAKELEKTPEPNVLGTKAVPVAKEEPKYTREEMFDKVYFNGGGKVGGYAREGYRDFPVHEITARHILARKPKSVLEIGAARGYVLKRIEDAGVLGAGLEISKHCYLTRVSENVFLGDLCKSNPFGGIFWNFEKTHKFPPHGVFDLCYSVATLEHIPEEYLPEIIAGMKRASERGLHGVDFGEKDDGFDKTHTTLKPKGWWLEQFQKYAPGYPVEIVDKEELERGEFPKEVLEGDGKIKLNVGSHTVMFHHGWVNMDILDLNGFAQANGYKFRQHDIKTGLPYGTGVVDCLFSSHCLEHLSYADGLAFLRECRRVIRKDGVMRILVPDAKELMNEYLTGDLSKFSEVNDGVEKAETNAARLWALLHEGHASCYDVETLSKALTQAGWEPHPSAFRECVSEQMKKETTEMFADLTLFMDAVPKIG